MALLDVLVEEEAHKRRRDEQERQMRDTVERNARALGRGYREKHIETYMKSRLRGGRDIVDASGRTYKMQVWGLSGEH